MMKIGAQPGFTLRPEINLWWGLNDPMVNPLNPSSSGLAVGRVGGPLNHAARRFADDLHAALEGHLLFKDTPLTLSTTKQGELLGHAAASLARSREGQLEWLIWQGVIAPEHIADVRKREVTGGLVDTFALSLHSIMGDFIENGVSGKRLEYAAKRLLNRPFIEGLRLVFDEEGIASFFEAEGLLDGLMDEQRSEAQKLTLSLANAWHFAVGNITNSEDGVKRALRNAISLLSFDVEGFLEKEGLLEGLEEEDRLSVSRGLTLSLADAWHFAVNNITNPEDGVRRALRNAVALLSFDMEGFLEKEGLLEGLTDDDRRSVSQGLTLSLSDAWYFAVHNISNPEDGVRRALRNAVSLLSFDAEGFLEDEGLLEGLTDDDRLSVSRGLTLSLSDAWRFAVNNISHPEEGVKRALRNAVSLLSFDVGEFLKDEGFLEGLTDDDRRSVSQGLTLSLSNAWYFAVHNITNPEDGVRRALRNAVSLLSFDVEGFLKDEGLLEGLTGEDRLSVSRGLTLSLADAWHFAVGNITNPEDGVRRAIRNAKTRPSLSKRTPKS